MSFASSSLSNCYIVDVQGFQCGPELQFCCKEIAIYDCTHDVLSHRIVRFPFTASSLNFKIRRHVGFLKNTVHGLNFDCVPYTEDEENSIVSYEQLGCFIKSTIWNQNADVFVKGMGKKLWLETIIANNIIDVGDVREDNDISLCPSVGVLKDVFKSRHCNLHENNSLKCALENVYNIFTWYKFSCQVPI